MKVNFHYHFYSRIVISLLIFACGFFLWQESVDTRALVDNVYKDNTTITGWAWNDQMGWIALSCENDFDGDGEPDGDYNVPNGTCTGNPWGLVMNVDDSDLSVKHIQGCAWAGNVADMSTDDTAPGWICFSDPGGTEAPANGVLMSQAGGEVTTCSCETIRGTCPADSAINKGLSCSSYSNCTGTNKCNAGTCSLSGDTCNIDFDCQFACKNDANPAFVLKGVCYDYDNDTSEQQLILEDLRGTMPPFTTGDDYMHSCYINKDCYDQSDIRNIGHTSGECVYPQYGILPSGGAGKCMVSPSVEQGSGTSCVYDFDCTVGNYCALTLNTNFLPGAPTSCTASCTGGYEPVNTTITQSFYTNALTINPLQAEGFASILQMESSGYADANKIGFPVDDQVKDVIFVNQDPTYDIDNPNNVINDNNPIRGCFNCYREKTFQCASGASCSCNQNLNSCIDASCGASSEGNNTCSLSALAPAVCENCQEYFYYTEAQNTCSIRTDISCSNIGGACDNNFGTCLAHSEGDLKKVLTGFNCTDCIVDDFANSCSLNAENINSNRCNDCRTFLGGDPNDYGNYTSDVYRLGGVLYDNQHGRSNTGALCGWGYNAYQGATGRDGFGWFNFSPRISTSTKPYFSVEQGNIYSGGNISTLYQPPINKYNASYLIEAGGVIRNFVSGVSKSSVSTSTFKGELANRPAIDFLSLSAGKYTNALGKLDYTGLITVVSTSGGVDKNKYGSPVEVLPGNFDHILTMSTAFQNTVYLVDENGIINNNNLEVKVGNDNTESGAGIIIVDGNLQINKNITYQSIGTINNLRQIPSLVWIVKGDVIIDPAVTEVVGTFIILGSDSALPQCNGLTDLDNNGCGQFKSGIGANQLIIRGNVLAKKFILKRTYSNAVTGAPAEQFINDGRLQTNPPAGLKDISGVIPRFSSY